MPTLEYEDDEVEELCGVTEEYLEEDGKGEMSAIIMGDWNRMVGDKSYWNTVEPYWLGRRNQRGQRLSHLCERNELVITNTWFKKSKTVHLEIEIDTDYIPVKHRFRHSMNNMQTLPGADTDSDHSLLLAKICTRLKKTVRFWKEKPRWNLEKLNAQCQKVQHTLEEKLFAVECESRNVEVQWNNMKKCVLDTISDLVRRVKRRARQPWITQEIISKMDEWSARMSKTKKEELQRAEEWLEKSQKTGQEGISWQ